MILRISNLWKISGRSTEFMTRTELQRQTPWQALRRQTGIDEMKSGRPQVSEQEPGIVQYPQPLLSPRLAWESLHIILRYHYPCS